MGVFTDHSHTAITEKINTICETDLEPDIELPELLNTIKLQYSGAIEAARAIRKKLKYGTKKEQLKSVDLLNSLVVNGGRNLEELYNDRKLLERLKLSAGDVEIDAALRKKIILYAVAWNREFSNKRGYGGISQLKTQLPVKVKIKPRNFMADEAYYSDDDDDDDSADEFRDSNAVTTTRSAPAAQRRPQNRPRVNRDLNAAYEIPKIDMKKAAPKIKLLIAEASQASTDLMNSLQGINRERGESSTQNKKATLYFDKSRIIRRKILHYLQLVESEEFLGSLIHANDELVAALQRYADYADEDDESDESNEDDASDQEDLSSVTDSLASSIITNDRVRQRYAPKLARSETTESNPFGDSNVVDEAAEWK